eukprot:gene9066-17305_t
MQQDLQAEHKAKLQADIQEGSGSVPQVLRPTDAEDASQDSL